MGAQSISTILVSRILQGILVVFVVLSVVFLVSRLARNPVEYLTTDQTTIEGKGATQRAARPQRTDRHSVRQFLGRCGPTRPWQLVHQRASGAG